MSKNNPHASPLEAMFSDFMGNVALMFIGIGIVIGAVACVVAYVLWKMTGSW